MDYSLLAGHHVFHERGAAMRRGFTLIEILVVVTIIVIVSVIALPFVLPAFQHREVSEAARILQGALTGARDNALQSGAPSGIRLLPDPAFPPRYLPNGQIDPTQPLAASRIIPIAPAPDYSEGTLLQWKGLLPQSVANLPYPGPGIPANPNPTYGQTSVLMVVESIIGSDGTLQNPTSWYWNIRIGDKIQIGGSGKFYTVVGPMNITPAMGNAELFVNVGPPGTRSPLADPNGSPGFPEFLLLVNGRDDNGNGWIDEGFDGADNDGVNGADDIGEWIYPLDPANREIETW
jgi:prepilin-type N-terminal cleavage/methylation domain-containing protein